jgi:hypothetical protein
VHLIREIPDERDEKCFIEWYCQLQRLYSVSGKRNQKNEALVEWYQYGENELLRENSVPVPFGLPPFPQGLA